MPSELQVQQSSAANKASASRSGAPVELIVLHNSYVPAAEALAGYAASEPAMAPHYHIARDGTITQLVPEARAAQHSGNTTWKKRSRNIDRISIGIALEGAPLAGLSDPQATALLQLVAAIQQRHSLPADAVYLWAGEIDLAEGQSLLRPAMLPQPQPKGPVVLHADDTAPAPTSAPAGQPPAPPVVGSGPFPIPSSGMVSHWPDYGRVPEPVRQLIGQALRLLGTDPDVIGKVLTPAQRRSLGVSADIVCADGVLFSLQAAGLDLAWKVDDPSGAGKTGPRCANYYRPCAGNAGKLRDVTGEPPLPGDIFVFGKNDFSRDRGYHVDIYVGPLSGTDTSGRTYRPEQALDVVDTNMGDPENKPFPLSLIMTRKRGFPLVRRVRLLQLEQIYRSAGLIA
ncbi:MAG TPA: peptidoglycan recognition family protein [Roseiflexaceae bacterium]|nr:peptidoglycan recognition family protein [Roseiflexaceae bacterium]